MILPIFTLTLEPSNPLHFSLDKLRSFFQKKSAEYTTLHKDSTTAFIHRYPVVQCKLIKSMLMVIGISQGADLLQEISVGRKELGTGENTCAISRPDQEIRNEEFTISDKIQTYEFLTPWLALNQQNAKKFYDLKGKPERDAFMQKILIGHLTRSPNPLTMTCPHHLRARAGCGSNENGFSVKMSWCSSGRLKQISIYLITWESGSQFHQDSGRYGLQLQFRIRLPRWILIE